MLAKLKALVVTLFLSKEVAALKSRLSEASTALDNIEKEVVSVAKEAPAEAQALAEKVLSKVLTSADKVRSEAAPFVHDWEAKLYNAYEAGKTSVESTISHAEALAKKTEVFFASKL